MTNYLKTNIVCRKHNPPQHPLECPCAKRTLAQHPKHEAPVPLGNLGVVYLHREPA